MSVINVELRKLKKNKAIGENREKNFVPTKIQCRNLTKQIEITCANCKKRIFFTEMI